MQAITNSVGRRAGVKHWPRVGYLRALVVWTLTVSACMAAAWPGDVLAQGRVVTISEVTIVGRVQKPIAAVDVSRIQPRLTLAELRQKFTDRIERALYRAPF